MIRIDCGDWSPSGADRAGRCASGKYGGAPTFSQCAVCMRGGGATKRSLASKAVSYAKAEVSLLIKGELPPVDRDARWRVCSGRTWDGVQVGPACPEFREHARHAGDGWCDACSCGDRSSARLRRKATMPDAECPFIDRWTKR